MFMGTFTGTTLQWFSGIPDGQITSFPRFSINKVKPPRLYELFSVRETLKDYLNRFCAVTVKLQTHDEEMMIAAFERSLIKNPAETFYVLRKNDSSRSRQLKPKESNRGRP